MTTLRPFFLLIGRASAFWLAAIGLFTISITVAGLASEPRLSLYVDAAFIAAFAFPAAAGWLAGTVIQEFQHTTIAALLPRVRTRIASGFLIAGIGTVLIVAITMAAMSGAPQHLPVLFAVGLGAYCLGGILVDPMSYWITTLNTVVVLFVIGSSRDVARFALAHPGLTVVVSLGIAAAGCWRLFSRSTFRHKPFRATPPVPGRFSLEKTREYRERQKIQDGPTRNAWRGDYLGHDSWRWVRAAFHEAHGARGWKTVARAASRAWGLVLIPMASAWIDKGGMGFGEALAKSLNDALLRSPHQPQFGEHGGPYLFVALVIAAVGIIWALFSPVALSDAMTYPLSRRQRAQVLFRGGLVDAGIFLFVLGPCLLAIGHFTGWWVGYEIRFDYMPYFLRALLVTLILLPLAHRGRLGLQAATRRRNENTQVAVIFGIIGFVTVALFLIFISPLLFSSPLAELGALIVALLASQAMYRHRLTTYYRTADLA